ncbi:MAG: HAMP domain-containing histidine kinase [Bacteroidales bacterium]|nr:HAMP domain-containing histidine kinase [Bacteroidales bacterium]
MSKKVIIGLAYAMGLVLLGLIYVQYRWVQIAFNVNEEQFDQMIHRALTDAISRLEQRETMNSLLNELYMNKIDSAFFTPHNPNQDIHYNIDKDSVAVLNSENIVANFSFKHSDSRGNVIDTNFSIQLHSPTPNNRSQQERMRQEYQRRKQLIQQMLSANLYSAPNIENRVNNQLLVEYIEASLENYGIDLAFEYAVANMNTLTSFTSNRFKPDVKERIYRVRLFPNDIFETSNYLSVYFPKRKQYIYYQLGFMGGISSILIFVIIGIFAFTLFVIFKQKQLSEMKNDFVSNMTHELKTPISTISLASQMLGDKNIPTESKNLTRISDIIAQESKRLGYQVEKVLQAAVFNQGKLKLKTRKIDFHEIIETSAANFTIQVESKGGILVPSLHAEKSEVVVDKVHMTNVLSNLLDNALKYCDKTPEIIIETRNVNDNFIFSVRDNGMGISKSDQKRIFERFFRVSTGNVHNIKGFGLGLSYVRKIVEEHKGIISIDSEPGKGSVFTIEIPLFKN